MYLFLFNPSFICQFFKTFLFFKPIPIYWVVPKNQNSIVSMTLVSCQSFTIILQIFISTSNIVLVVNPHACSSSVTLRGYNNPEEEVGCSDIFENVSGTTPPPPPFLLLQPPLLNCMGKTTAYKSQLIKKFKL